MLLASRFFDDGLAKVLSEKRAIVLAHELVGYSRGSSQQDHKHLELFIGEQRITLGEYIIGTAQHTFA